MISKGGKVVDTAPGGRKTCSEAIDFAAQYMDEKFCSYQFYGKYKP